MTRYEVMRIWRSVSPESIITEDGLRICEAIRNNALEEAAEICEMWNSTPGGKLSGAIRALKSTANGAGGQG